MSSYKLIFVKAFHFPIELEHKTSWPLKKSNLDWNDTTNARLSQLYQMEEFWLEAYENAAIYKEKLKRWHDMKHFQCKF